MLILMLEIRALEVMLRTACQKVRCVFCDYLVQPDWTNG